MISFLCSISNLYIRQSIRRAIYSGRFWKLDYWWQNFLFFGGGNKVGCFFLKNVVDFQTKSKDFEMPAALIPGGLAILASSSHTVGDSSPWWNDIAAAAWLFLKGLLHEQHGEGLFFMFWMKSFSVKAQGLRVMLWSAPWQGDRRERRVF